MTSYASACSACRHALLCRCVIRANLVFFVAACVYCDHTLNEISCQVNLGVIVRSSLHMPDTLNIKTALPQSCVAFPWSAGTWTLHAYTSFPSNDVLSTRFTPCRHFGEPPPGCQAACDCCGRGGVAGTVRKDVTTAARDACAVLMALPAAEKRATLTQLLKAWRSKVRCRARAAAVGGGTRGTFVACLLLFTAFYGHLQVPLFPISTSGATSYGPLPLCVRQAGGRAGRGDMPSSDLCDLIVAQLLYSGFLQVIVCGHFLQGAVCN